MDDKKNGKKSNLVDLGIIRVKSRGARDVIYLGHNDLLAFTVTCTKGQDSRLKVSRAFKQYDTVQFSQVFNAYIKWKRAQLPDFKLLPNHSGRTLEGDPHPWRAKGFF